MTSYKFPGVYPSIRDLSGVVATNAVTACAYVGEAEYGPINTPVLLTGLQDYTKYFGEVSSEYGYAGYSLAVAAESINEHYFVRTVPTGEAGMEADTDAKWAVQSFAAKGKVKAKYSPMFYSAISAAEKSRDESNSGDSGLFVNKDLTKDMDTAFIVTATDPNNRSFYITIEDSTINENKAVAPKQIEFKTNEGETSTHVEIAVDPAFVKDIEIGDNFIVSGIVNGEEVDDVNGELCNGVFKVADLGEVELEGNTYTVVGYVVDAIVTGNPYLGKARAGFYPADNETSFRLIVSEKVGRVYQALETFEYCTLYKAKDNFGNSTYLEDMVNGYSDYIQIFVNKNVTETMVPENIYLEALTKGQSGTWGDEGKDVALNANWEHFRDRSQVNVSLLMNSGYVNKGNVAYQSKMLEIAEDRRDCFCLFDAPMSETDYENLIDWRKNIQGFNSYRGAVASPWVKAYDSLQGRANFVMCPSAYIAKIIGAGQPWQAPAGLNRGMLSASAVSPSGLTQYYNSVQGGNLYADNQINCIIKNPGAGYVSWGQRTLQAKPSALDRINVARTVIYIETVLRDAAKWHLFENNTAYQRLQISMQFANFLDTVLTAEGIQRYQVVCDESNNTPIVIANNQLAIDIYLWPTYTAEVILLRSTIMGVDAEVTVSGG